MCRVENHSFRATPKWPPSTSKSYFGALRCCAAQKAAHRTFSTARGFLFARLALHSKSDLDSDVRKTPSSVIARNEAIQGWVDTDKTKTRALARGFVCLGDGVSW
jgi:hypothetical protein